MLKQNITFIGAGNMAQAIIGGLLSQKIDIHLNLSIQNINKERNIPKQENIKYFTNNKLSIENADIIILAVKPYQIQKICEQIKDHIPQKSLIISVAAGIQCQQIKQWLNNTENTIVRAMPNTPCHVNCGVIGLFSSKQISNFEKKFIDKLFEVLGYVLWVKNENLIDVVAAVSGSGPAYFFYFMEIMINTSIQLGLNEKEAKKIVIQTVLGASKMALLNNEVEKLREQVTSPKGTTEEAIKSLKKDDFQEIIAKAINAAYNKSKVLV